MTLLRTATRSIPSRLSLSLSSRKTTITNFQAGSLRFASNADSRPVAQPPSPLQSYQPDSTTPKDLQQSPNVPTTWSTSQNPKAHAFNNPRFEQTKLDLQPNSMSAMGMVAEDPVRLVNGRKAVCDGGGGPLGHPKIFINLDKPGPKSCGYCGIKYEQAHEHH